MPDHILDHLQILPKYLLATILPGTGKDESRGEWNSGSILHSKHTLDQRPTLFDMDILESTNMIQELVHWHTRSWDFLAFRRSFIVELMCVNVYISWKGVKKVEPDSSQWDLVKGKEGTGANWDIQNYIWMWEKANFYSACVKHWNRLLRELVDSLSLELFKNLPGTAPSDLL